VFCFFLLFVVLAFFEFSPRRLRPALTGYGVPRRKSVLAVHRCTARSLAGCYAKNGDFFEQKKTKAAKHPSRLRTQKNSLCFLRCLLSKPSGEIITARPKNKSAHRFFTSGRKLDVASIGGELRLVRQAEPRPHARGTVRQRAGEGDFSSFRRWPLPARSVLSS